MTKQWKSKYLLSFMATPFFFGQSFMDTWMSNVAHRGLAVELLSA